MKTKQALSTMLLITIFLTVTPVIAETAITSLPYTITASGSYYISSDLTSTEHGIWVAANNVSIDLRGHSLVGPGSDLNPYNGIYTDNKTNIEIRNGTVRNYWKGITSVWTTAENFRIIDVRVVGNGVGISLYGANHYIESVLASNNDTSGIYLGPNAMVTGTLAHNNNNFGILAEEGSTMINNTAHDNGLHGIYSGNGSTLRSNTSYNNGNAGVACLVGCTVIDNSAYQNGNVGIFASEGAVIKNNSAYANVNYGISTYSESLIDGNTAYGNGTSIRDCPTCTFGVNHAP